MVFLVVSPLLLFFSSRCLGSCIVLPPPCSLAVGIAGAGLLASVMLLAWAPAKLWFDGMATPGPIVPGKKSATTDSYVHCRNPSALGADLYFLFAGIRVDTFSTGLLCMSMGMRPGYGSREIIEGGELKLRLAQSYPRYLASTPLVAGRTFVPRKKNHG